MNKFCIDLDLGVPLFKPNIDPMLFPTTYHMALDNTTISNELKDLLWEHKMYPAFFEYFYKSEFHTGNIHSDTDKLGDWPKLNWVFGGEDSTMSWYMLKDGAVPIINNTNANTYSLHFNSEDLILAHTQHQGTPSLIQSGIPHSAKTLTKVRRCFSLCVHRDKQRPTWDDMISAFSKYIK